ncbi:MAG: DUF2807 domain-containing protein [Tannerella sp.]|jgi:hypothetical protein|nr:DUF2807 domain-containing protein [Tannerella sp.]
MKKLIVICLIAVFAVQSCTRQDADMKNYTEQKSFDSFEGIKVCRLMKVKIVKGNEYGVKTTVPERYAESLSVTVDPENNLVIDIHVSGDGIKKKRSGTFEAEITCPSFSRIVAGDITHVEVLSAYSPESLELKATALSSITFKEPVKVNSGCRIDVSDLSKIKLDIEAVSLDIKSRAISSVTASGTVSVLDVSAGNMAKIKCRGLIAKTVHATAFSMSEIFVHADEKLELSATDLSKIRYYGDGEVLRKRCESLSMVKKE